MDGAGKVQGFLTFISACMRGGVCGKKKDVLLLVFILLVIILLFIFPLFIISLVIILCLFLVFQLKLRITGNCHVIVSFFSLAQYSNKISLFCDLAHQAAIQVKCLPEKF